MTHNPFCLIHNLLFWTHDPLRYAQALEVYNFTGYVICGTAWSSKLKHTFTWCVLWSVNSVLGLGARCDCNCILDHGAACKGLSATTTCNLGCMFTWSTLCGCGVHYICLVNLPPAWAKNITHIFCLGLDFFLKKYLYFTACFHSCVLHSLQASQHIFPSGVRLGGLTISIVSWVMYFSPESCFGIVPAILTPILLSCTGGRHI